MRRRWENVRPPIAEVALEKANDYPSGTCLVCGRRATAFTSERVPKLFQWMRSEIGHDELAAAVYFAHPGVEGCFISEGAGISVCATKGVTR